MNPSERITPHEQLLLDQIVDVCSRPDDYSRIAQVVGEVTANLVDADERSNLIKFMSVRAESLSQTGSADERDAMLHARNLLL